ncbi:probable serine/threonine-protein kinase irlA isoform X2 [Labeo rohita]|uniref:probable serine/threonine-protein kinase irlA isoform X2 n=1 Tax=Labeo rohita TaxID=84645 RepID=UPI0021E26C29|nr:probable serine/threonine-protein kinase irlA isoform X2 [Labeo rohita]
MAVVNEGALKKMLKKYKYKDDTVRDITNVISQYKDLKPVMDAYIFNDQSSKTLMSLAGTVPISYRGNVYNIPVCLWLLDTHPYNPPVCFVKPTSAMIIKTGKHIDRNGKIYLPYLHEWKHPQSDLYGLIQVMTVEFGEEPPVFSRPTTQPPSQAIQAAGPLNRVQQEIPGSSAQTSSEVLETESLSQNMEILQMEAVQRRSEDKQITWRNESSTRHSTKIKELLIEPDLKNIGSLYFYKDEKYMIGSGGGGTQVYIGIREDGFEVAIKIIPKNPKNNKDFENELKLMQSIKLESKNIVRYMTFVKDKDFYYLANQLCEYDLVDYMEYLRQSEQNENEKKNTLKRKVNEMLLGLKVLHHADVIHRDIKPRNVLIDLEGRARLADFSISRRLEEGKTTMYTDRAGTQGWEATEIVNQTEKGSYKKSSDIQVAGMLTYYILSDGKHPFGDGIRREVNISEGKYSLGDIEDIAAKDLIEWMINKDKNERPTIDKVLNHPYFWDDKRKEGVIMKLGERNEVQYYINISKICETKKAEEGLTAKEAVERTLSEKKDISRKTTILMMLGETDEDQIRNLENLSKLCVSAKKITQGKSFNKWKSELSGVDKNLPEDILGLLRTYCNKLKHDSQSSITQC